jgi:multiple sugar transport system substrate-binding protein
MVSSSFPTGRRYSRRSVIAGVGSVVSVGLLAACGGSVTASTSASTQATASSAAASATSAPVVSTSAASAATTSATSSVASTNVATSSAATASPAASAPANAKGAVTIQWATRTVQAWKDIWPAAVKLYQQQQPGVTVQLVGPKDSDLSAYLVAWAGGSGPDVAAMWGTNLVNAGRKGQLLIQDSYIARDKFPVDDYISYQLKAMQWQGHQFSLPMYINVYPLYYNKQLFQQKGIAVPDSTWTWQTYQDMLLKFTDKAAGTYGAPIFQDWGPGYAKAYAAGGSLEDTTDPTKVGWAAQPSLDAFQWIYDRVWKDGSVVIEGTDAWKALGVKDRAQGFTAGKLAMMEEGSANPKQLADSYPQQVPDWDLAVLPKGPAKRAASGSIDAWALWSQTRNPDAVWEFNKFLQGSDYLDLQCTLGAMQHPRSSMQDRYVSLMKKTFPAMADKNLEAFADIVRNKYAYPNGGIFAQDDQCWTIFFDAYTKSIMKNQQDVKTAFEAAATQAEGVLAKG